MKKLDMRLIFLLICLLITKLSLATGEATSIRLHFIDGPTEKIILAYSLGDKQYEKLAVETDKKGNALINTAEKLEKGLYILAFPEREMSYFNIIISDDQDFDVHFSAKGLTDPGQIKFGGSIDNSIFYEYIVFKTNLQKKSESLIKENNPNYAAQNKAINDEFDAYMFKLRQEYPNSFLVKMNSFMQRPTIQESLSDNKSRFYYYRDHFFDYADWSFDAIVRTSLLNDFYKEYIYSLTAQDPDSIIKNLDVILGFASKNNEIFKVLLIQCLNEFAKSKIICMDAVYVHIVKKYYATGKATWMNDNEESKQNLKKITENASHLENSLCGKHAFNFGFVDNNENNSQLSAVKGKYTILVFWDIETGNSSAEFEFLASKMDSLKKLNVAVVECCISADQTKKLNTMMKFSFPDLITTSGLDKNTIEIIKEKYHVVTKPTLFLLDENKRIVLKNISAEQAFNFIKND